MIKYIRRENILAESLEDHLVMLDIEKGKYFSLNAVAIRIWNLLEEPLSSEQLCHALQKEFEVKQDQCKKEVEELLKELAKHKLISKAE